MTVHVPGQLPCELGAHRELSEGYEVSEELK